MWTRSIMDAGGKGEKVGYGNNGCRGNKVSLLQGGARGLCELGQ